MAVSVGSLIRKLRVTYPDVVQIYLDTVCNLDCWFCLYKGRTDIPHSFNVANLDKLETAIRRAKTVSISAIGEPLASPHFEEVLRKIYGWNSKRDLISIVTNGLLLTNQTASLLMGHLADLSVSINSGAARQVKAFMDVIPSADILKVSLHYVAHTGNMEFIPDIVETAQECGIIRVRVDQFMAAKKEHLDLCLINKREEYNGFVWQAAEKADQYGIEFTARQFGDSRQSCISPWVEAHVWPDGRVAPCCYNGSLFLGNAFESGFESVWFGKRYSDFRHDLAVQCFNCPRVLPFDDERVHIYPYLMEKLNELA